MARWFTADLHLGHANIIRYSHRPYSTVKAMDEDLIRRWNEAVCPADEVVVVGDFAMGRIDDTLGLTGRLHGRKILLAGNHDRCWSGHGERSAAWVERYLDAGFAEVWQGTVALELAGRSVFACHFPHAGDSGDTDRFVEHRPADDGRTWLLHGHVHEKWRVHDRQINVGVDMWDYRPVAESRLVALIG